MRYVRELVRRPLFGFPSLLLGCPPCSDDLIQQASSPDNIRIAISSLRNCGATTSFYTRVIVRPTAKSTNGIEQLVFSARNSQKIELSWKSASELVVSCHSCHNEDIEIQVMRVGTLRIRYALP